MQQVLFELLASRQHIPRGRKYAASPVEYQLVLPPDQVGIEDVNPVVPCPVGQHLLPEPALAPVIGRAVDVQDDPGPGVGLDVGRPRLIPDVLTHVHPDTSPVDIKNWALAARLEIALLVEDTVVGQMDLVIYAEKLAVLYHRGGVEKLLIPIDEPDYHGDPRRMLDNLVETLAVIANEVVLIEKVFGGVARDGQLGEGDEIGALGPGPVDILDDLGRVSPQIADGGVDLGESCSEFSHGSTRQGPAPPARLEYSTGDSCPLSLDGRGLG